MTPSEPYELSRLIARLSDGSLAADEQTRLNAWLQADPAAQEAYLDHMALDAHLEREFGAALPGPTPAVIPAPPRRFRRMGWLAVAAAILAAALIALFPWPGDRSVVLARLSDVAEPVWGDMPATPTLGCALQRQALRLQAGAAQITFASGAVLTLTGPAEMDLLGPTQVLLRQGRVVSYVPPSGHGFTVVSPDGQIVDLGTEFSLDVDVRGHSQVHVIDGSVRVEPGHGRRRAATQLTTGYSALLDDFHATRITESPLLLDRFEAPSGSSLNADLGQRQTGGQMTAEYENLDLDTPAQIRDGTLEMPFEGRQTQRPAVSRVMLARDFRELVGRRYTIAFKLSLPQMGSLGADGWAAFVLWDGDQSLPLPVAFQAEANVSVMLSPRWQVGVRVAGQSPPNTRHSTRVFPRARAAGPYRVVLTVDETAPGAPLLDLTVNGVRVLAGLPVRFGKGRHLGFHTWAPRGSAAQGSAQVDDLCVSLEMESGKP